MQDAQLVERLEPADHLNDNLPDVLLLHELFVVLALADALEDVSIVSELHHNANTVAQSETDMSSEP